MLMDARERESAPIDEPRRWRRSDTVSLAVFLVFIAGLLVYREATYDRCDEMRDQGLDTVYVQEWHDLGCSR